MYKSIWIGMLILALLLLIISIALIILWRVPNLIDEISGRKAKRYVKRLQRINSTTNAFDKMSTNEVYMGIPSEMLLDEDFSELELGSSVVEEKLSSSSKNINIEKKDSINSVENEGNEGSKTFLPNESLEEEENTTFLDEGEGEDSTTFLSNESSEDEEESTSFLEDEEDSTSFLDSNEEVEKGYKIKIIEEQGSIF